MANRSKLILLGVAVVVVVAVAVCMKSSIRGRPVGPSSVSGPIESPESAAATGKTEDDPTLRDNLGTPPVKPQRPESVAAQMKAFGKDIVRIAEQIRANMREMQAAEDQAIQNDPELKALLEDIKQKEEILKSKLAELPAAKSANDSIAAAEAERAALMDRVRALQAHIANHGRPSASVAAAQTAKPAPRTDCEFCKEDFEALVEGRPDLLKKYEAMQRDWTASAVALDKEIALQRGATRLAEVAVRKDDPEIGELTAAIRTKRGELRKKLNALPQVAELTKARRELAAERSRVIVRRQRLVKYGDEGTNGTANTEGFSLPPL